MNFKPKDLFSGGGGLEKEWDWETFYKFYINKRYGRREEEEVEMRFQEGDATQTPPFCALSLQHIPYCTQERNNIKAVCRLSGGTELGGDIGFIKG